MLLIMIITRKRETWRVYYDTKYNDWIILTPKFGTTRYLPTLRFDSEINAKIEKRIAEVEKMLSEFRSREIKPITISIR